MLKMCNPNRVEKTKKEIAADIELLFKGGILDIEECKILYVEECFKKGILLVENK